MPSDVVETRHGRVVGRGAELSVTQWMWVDAVEGRQQDSIANI